LKTISKALVFEKSSKNFSITAGFGAASASARRSKNFLLLFSKKEALALPSGAEK
jgi:hypothetical protein